MLYTLEKTLFLINLSAALFLSVLVGTPLTAQAQINFPDAETTGVEQMILKISPTSPGPGQTITAEVTSTMVDLSRSDISWSVNGKPFATSGNDSRISLTVPAIIGARTSIGVTAQTDDGQTLTREQTVQTSALDLLWEATSYVHPFYKGKGLPAAGSRITVAVIPDIRDSAGRKFTTDELIYTWKQNSLVIPNVSGKGRSSATFPGPEFYKSFDVIVEVSSPDNSVQALGRLTLDPVNPRTLLYESHPTLGIRFEQALSDTVQLPGGEIVISAQPLFFEALRPSDKNLKYEWSLNGAVVSNPSNDQSVIVFRADKAGGRAEVGISTKHFSKVFQQAQGSLGINFAGNPTP